ncbi:MAG: malonyl-ACP O-methyltransferase BioC [Rhodocyclaceae bacterium]|nr:malonyl-ACP O-methyltransferase BioC [Rhodocyclaceae bacterium]
MSDLAGVQRAFGRAARRYDAAAVLQREVGSRMLERLDYIRLQPQRIVDLGCGTGAWLGPLRQRFRGADVTGIDLALPMLQTAAARDTFWRRLLARPSATLVCAGAEALPLPNGSADLVWSNLMLQWLPDPQPALAEAWRVLRPGGLVMFSTFGPDTLRELREAFAGGGHAAVNRFADMHDIGDALVQLRYADPVMDAERLELTYADFDGVVRDLRVIGATHLHGGRSRGLGGRARWALARQRYEAHRRADGRLPATFEAVYGHAWKPAHVRADGAAVVTFRRRAPA